MPSQPVLRTGRFSFREPLLFFPRLRLRADHIELLGWSLWGRYRRSIALGGLLRTDATRAGRLLLWLDNGETLRLRVDDAPAWKKAIDASRLRLSSRPSQHPTI